jgi:hypothetical protein
MKLVLQSLLFLTCCLVIKLSSAEQWLYLGEGFQHTSGYIGLKLSQYDVKEASSSADDNGELVTSLTGRILNERSWQGFVVRPWIATTTYTARLEADFNQYNLNENESNTSLRGWTIAKVNLYQDSQYPTILKLDQRVTKTYGTEDNSIWTRHLAINNSYKPEGKTYSASTQYVLTVEDETNEDYSNLENMISFTFGDYLEASNYRITSRWEKQDQSSNKLDTIDEDSSLRYNHYWSKDESSSTSFSFDVSNESDTAKSAGFRSEFERLRTQATVTSFIKSKSDERLSFTLNGFANRTNFKVLGSLGNTVDDTQDTVNLSAGAFFDYSDKVEFNGSLEGLYSKDVRGKGITTTSGFLSGTYQDQRELPNNVLLDWFVTDSVLVSQGDESFAANRLSVGDSFSKDFNVYDSNMAISLDQGIRHETTSESKNTVNEWELTHDLTVNWGSTGSTGKNTSVYLLMSDVRHLTDDQSAFQNVYFNLKRNQHLGRGDSWGGDLVYEWSNATGPKGVKTKSTTMYGRLSYRDTQFWGIRNALFTSVLTVPFDTWLYDDSINENKLANWENDLRYRVGFLELRLFTIHTIESYYMSLEINRNFDF